MKKKMALGVKLVGGFVIVALITLGVGFVGWHGMSQLDKGINQIGEEALPSVQCVLQMSESYYIVKAALRTLFSPTLDAERRQRQYANIAKAREEFDQAKKKYDALGARGIDQGLVREIYQAREELKKANDLALQYSRELDQRDITNPLMLKGNVEKFIGDHYRLLSLSADLILSNTPFEGGDDPTQCGFGKWMGQFKTNNTALSDTLNAVKEHHNTFHGSVKKTKELTAKGDKDAALQAYVGQLLPNARESMKKLEMMRENIAVSVDLFDKMTAQILGPAAQEFDKAVALNDKLVEKEMQEATKAVYQGEEAGRSGRFMALSGMIGGALMALALGIVLALSITRPIRRVIDGLTEASDQVTAASGQVSGASQQLAEGASQQAASLEETSSSLEEMTSMTRQNAENANQANSLMNDTGKVVERAGLSMTELTAAMKEISTASEETAKIVKTIDEIAFQTNLLALNAAVEAARAGEAGAGFAVVADEVRNLAMRAAEAAKNTSHLIENTVTKVKDGEQLVHKTGEDFSQVAGSSAKVKELVGEIAAASNEQAQGVDQISKAVAEMDKVVQQNAANAEESASASEELSAQALQMKDSVMDLVTLVGGTNHKGAGFREVGPGRDMGQDKVRWAQKALNLAVKERPGAPRRKGNGGNLPVPVHVSGRTRAATPAEVIPLDHNDMNEF